MQNDLKRPDRRPLAALILAAVLLRAVLAVVTEPYEYDMNCFFAWALRMAEVGPRAFYAPDYFADYPPGYMLVLGLVGKLLGLLKLSFTEPAAWLVMSLPPILSAGGIVWVLWRIGLPRIGEKAALRVAAFAAFGPSLVYCTGVWMQIDEVFCLLILLAFRCIAEGRFFAGCVWYGVALTVKPQALLAGPVLAVCALAPLLERGLAPDALVKAAKRGFGGAACALAPVALLMPVYGVGPGWMLEKYAGTTQSYPYATINAFNWMEFLGGNWKNQDETLLLLSWADWGTLAILLLTVCMAVLAVRGLKNGRFDPLLLAAFYGVGVFTFSHRMHERYLLFGLVFTLAAAARWGSRRLLGAAAGLSLTSLVNLAVVYSSQGTEDEFLTSTMAQLTGRLAGLAAAVCFLALAWAAWELTARDEPEPLAAKPAEDWNALRPQPAWSRREALALAGLTLFTAVLSFTYLGEMNGPETFVDPDGSSYAVEEVTLTGAAHSAWVYGGITKGGTLTLTDAAGATVSHELRPGACFQWQQIGFDAPMTGTVTATVNGGQVFELSFRDGAGAALAVSGGGALADEQDAVPAAISQLNSMYFDEIYHGRTGYEQAHGLSIYETTHPPLGKVFIQLGILLFGMNGFGWRCAGALFGVLMVPVMYALCRRLTRKPWLAFTGAALLALDFMRFTQSRIATIDVYGTFFILLGALCMVWYCQSALEKGIDRSLLPMALGGLAFGLGCASKWTGIYSGAGLAVLFFGVLWARWRQNKPEFGREFACAIAGGVLFFVVVPLTVYVLSYFPYRVYDPTYDLNDWWRAQLHMLNYHSGLEATHSFESRWYAWPLMLRPVWYFMSRTAPAGTYASIAGFGSPVVWWGGTLALGALAWRQASGKGSRSGGAVLVMFAAQVLPWVLVTRCTFLYHYFPGAMFGLAAIVLWLARMEDERSAKRLACGLVAAAAVLFVWFYPALSGLPVGRLWAASLKWLPSWGFYIL